jgi:catechol 2,3-dioxygenase-like lactoylglutathione lyase family enzyme
MNVTNATASMGVRDIEAARKWFERLFARPADLRPARTLLEWKFEGGGALQIYELPERAGNGSVTLAVADLEEQAAHLEKNHIDTSTRTADEYVKTIMIADPDDNHIAFAQALHQGSA